MCYVNQVALHTDLFTAVVMPVRIKKGTGRGYFSRREGHNKAYNKSEREIKFKISIGFLCSKHEEVTLASD